MDRRILTLFGTRPEVIKLGPVVAALEERPGVRTVNVASSQHRDLVRPFVADFSIRVDHDLRVMRSSQTPSEVCARVLAALDPLLEQEQPDLVLVQGDTTTALAGALGAFHRRIPVGHVEAGLRTGNPLSPFPEEMNRRLISRLASVHFAATFGNAATLRAEGVDPARIVLTGNPVVDALHRVLRSCRLSQTLEQALAPHRERRRIALTTHRRESFGEVMAGHLAVLRRFVEKYEDLALFFPVHPNPAVREAATRILGGAERMILMEPLDYCDFIQLLAQSWLIVSDSGGVQEEAPTLGKPLLVLRENTERPESVECGIARLVGNSPRRLESLLEQAYVDAAWIEHARTTRNPFGSGDSGERIAEAALVFLAGQG